MAISKRYIYYQVKCVDSDHIYPTRFAKRKDAIAYAQRLSHNSTYWYYVIKMVEPHIVWRSNNG